MLDSGAALLLILDLDGTLAPIVRRPDATRLTPAVRRTLRRLAASPRVGLAVLSGRSLADLKRRVGLRGIIYGGCHGLELEGPGWRFRPARAPSLRARAGRAAAGLEQVISRFAGAHLERKGLAVAVHYRGVRASRLGALRGWVRRVAAQAGLTLLPGKKVWDLVPPGYRGKSKALSLIRDHLKHRVGARACLTLYAGDDATDAEAFRSLGARGLGIQVGGARGAADYRLRGVREVHALLRWIVGAVASPSW
ncbi:MAG: trehalose-phosphatase [candidate division NC10 bacterium]|nr:trehalose-phosphatase [candidate division NC10 bacterium]